MGQRQRALGFLSRGAAQRHCFADEPSEARTRRMRDGADPYTVIAMHDHVGADLVDRLDVDVVARNIFVRPIDDQRLAP